MKKPLKILLLFNVKKNSPFNRGKQKLYLEINAAYEM